MTITANDLRWYQSERMTDTDDGGGQMSATEIISGAENQIFDDLSDIDRAAGDLSLRKVYALVATAAPDKYLDAGVLVFTPPADPAVSVTAFSTGSCYDGRGDLREQLESGITAGARWNGWLWGPHPAGIRAITLWQRENAPLPSAGQRLYLAQYTTVSAATLEHAQVVWVTQVTDSMVEVRYIAGTYYVRAVVCEIAEPLRDEYAGDEPSRIDTIGRVRVYATRYNPDIISLVGARGLVAGAEVGEYAVQVDSLYSPLIPTALAEIALPDVTPGANTLTVVAAGTNPVTFNTTAPIQPGVNLFVGSPVVPGSLTVAVSGLTFSDAGGAMLLSGATVGAIDYANGILTWNDACPVSATAAKTVTFRPAAAPSRIANTTAIPVTMENRGFVWVKTIAPIPAAGTLRAAYRVNNEWYVLSDNGAGVLRGTDSSYGSGQINYTTGTVTLTTGGLPDMGSEIFLSWGVTISYRLRAESSVSPPRIYGRTAHPGVNPLTVSVSWLDQSGATLYLTDDGEGSLSGAAGTGDINYATGDWWVQPALVPAMGTTFSIDYEHSEPITETFQPAPGVNGVPFTLSHVPSPGTLVVTVDVELNLPVIAEWEKHTPPRGKGGKEPIAP